MDNSIKTPSVPRWERIGEKDNRILYRVFEDKVSVAKYDADKFETILPKYIDDTEKYQDYRINNPGKCFLRDFASVLTIICGGIIGFFATKKILNVKNKILSNIGSICGAMGTAFFSMLPAVALFRIPHSKDARKDMRQLQNLNIRFEKQG